MFNLIFVFLSLGASHDTTKILRPFPCHIQDEVETSFGWEQAAPGLWGGVFSSLIQIWFLWKVVAICSYDEAQTIEVRISTFKNFGDQLTVQNVTLW